MRCRALWLVIVVSLWSMESSADDPWPSKPVHVLVSSGVGGVVDLRARWLAERLSLAAGRPFIVENHPGGGGKIGMRQAAASAPDGNTLIIVHQGSMAANPHLFKDLGYDPLRDFRPLTRLGHGPLMLVVSPSASVPSVAALVALARSKSLNYGSPGMGTPPHLAAELFKRDAKLDAAHVAYKSGAQSIADLIGGRVDFSIEGLTLAGPQVRAGRLRALAVTSRERVPAFPEVPTMQQAGIANYEYIGWVGVVMPAATPTPMAEKAHAAIARQLSSPEAREWFALAGADSTPDSPAAFAAFIQAEYDKWGRVIREAGITPE